MRSPKNLRNKKGVDERLVPFHELQPSEKNKIKEGISRGMVEVHCPWWNKGHWEKKVSGTPFYECFYRISPSLRIRCAAILWERDGQVYTGKSHSKIILDLFLFTGIKPIKGEQGFVTDCGIFVNRTEALEIANRAGQIKFKHGNKDLLFSEDLNYPDGPVNT